jgi:glucosamine 6-phosphate synthetase-like amidotransferase/phosphosugar isomerase protein
MCGIVAYFGGAGNNLTRVMTGMSAISYRAPDSTGVAIFGDDSEPVRTRKAVGSVEKLIEELIDNGAYRNYENQLISIWSDRVEHEKLLYLQKRLVIFEGFSSDLFETVTTGKTLYPSFDDLVDLDTASPARLVPGQPGRPIFKNTHAVRSRKSLNRLIVLLIKDYDLSPVVVREIIRKPLMAVIDSKMKKDSITSDKTEIMNCFDWVFESILSGKKRAKPLPDHRRLIPGNPLANKALWLCLQDTLVEIPQDYNRDGVCCLFRLLDAALLTTASYRPELLETLEQILLVAWPRHERPSPVSWKTLYLAEKSVNIYGRAAEAALTCLQRGDFLTEMLNNGLSAADIMNESAIIPGQTDPVGLRYFTQPIIAHGRWALQSAVTKKNAHPFLDENRQRSIVVNGQFDGTTEGTIKKFLSKVCGFSFRSENSSEYHCLLWGYYYRQLKEAQRRYASVLSQVKNDVQELTLGSNIIDYSVHRTVKGKASADLDRAAFIQATRQILKNGGQVAACGISVLSPRRLYVAVHNRPAFVVRRLENDDFMVVSDINAAMGLFPQQLIFEKLAELEIARTDFKERAAAIESNAADKWKQKALKSAFNKAKETILKNFSVEIHALEGEEIFVTIETGIANGTVRRRVAITDFDGNPLPEIEPFKTFLNPEQVKKNQGTSFFETHLKEIPDRLLDILKQYAPKEDQVPDFPIRKSLLRRRFGSNLGGLQRIVLAGTGSSYYMGAIAKHFSQTVMPEMDVLTITPGEIDTPESFFAPEKDLVILLSWSSTTADMVLLAKKLASLKVVMVAVTEKTYADMALIVARSGGLIPSLSHEEVTVSGVKSTVCLLFCLNLFCLWIASRIGREEEALTCLRRMHRIPHILSLSLEDETLRQFSNDVAGRYAQSRANIVISALHTDQAGGEIALKLEESTWSAVGKALDYQDVLQTGLQIASTQTLVLVDATCLARLTEALAVMDLLNREKVEFVTVGVVSQRQEDIQRLSSGRCTFLTDIRRNALQPIVNLVFYYQFAFLYGQAHGIATGTAPRNRAKSMTVSRSLFDRKISPARESARLKTINERLSKSPPASQDSDRPSLWEVKSPDERTRCYYQELREIARLMAADTPAAELFRNFDRNVKAIAHHLFDDNSDTGEIIFMPMDRWAFAAVKSAAGYWGRLLGYPVRIVSPSEPLAAFGDNVLLFAAAALPSSRDQMVERITTATCPVCLLGPEAGVTPPPDMNDNRDFLLKNGFPHALGDTLYTAINLIFINAWYSAAPEKAAIVNAHFRKTSATLIDVLNNPDLKESVAASVKLNSRYRTMFFIGPPTGAGPAWVNRLDHSGIMTAEHHTFGESAHGPLVTIDPRVEEKFIKVAPREKLIAEFGTDQVTAWEHRYFSGRDIDSFVKDPPADLSGIEKTPFYAGNAWFLPELNPAYNIGNDNLIVLDASWEHYFPQALDEISTLGCRYPRMILITQAAFLDRKSREQLYKFPVSSTIALPEIAGGPIPEMHLPFVLNIIGEEFYACLQS